MGSTGGNTSVNGTGYTTREEPIQVPLPRVPGQNQGYSKSYGEGNIKDELGNYHVYLTDKYGGKYVDKGTVDGYKIGQAVNIEGYSSAKIVTAHIYPNGGVDYNVEVTNTWGTNRRQFTQQTLDENNDGWKKRQRS